MRHDLHDSYCSRCGAPLHDRLVEGRARRACTRCPFVVWVHPTVGALAAVVRERAVLLVRRRLAPFQGHWTLPAGYVEIDETPADAARREVREETGLDVEVTGLLDVVCNDDDPRRRGLVVAYRARVVGGELRAGDDAEEVGYFPLDALPDALGFANNRRLLESLARGGRDGEETFR